MALTFRESTPAELRRQKRLMALEALCRQADTPQSLRVFIPSEGVNQLFRGRNATSKAASLAHQADEAGQEWHIQTGSTGWTVVESRFFHRMTAEEFNELVGELS